MIAALILGAVVACSLAALAWLVASAPEGFEDETGFHFHPRGPDTAGLSPAGEQPLLPSVTPPAAFSTSAHASGDSPWLTTM